MLYKLGLILFIAGTLGLFGSDTLFKRGKITTLKSLLMAKSIGLGLTILATIIMIIGK